MLPTSGMLVELLTGVDARWKDIETVVGPLQESSCWFLHRHSLWQQQAAEDASFLQEVDASGYTDFNGCGGKPGYVGNPGPSELVCRLPNSSS